MTSWSLHRFVVVAAMLCIVASGCKSRAERQAELDAVIAEKQSLESANQMKQLLMGISNYKLARGEWPAELSDVQKYVEMGNYEQLIVNPVTGANPGYEFTPPAEGEDEKSAVWLYQLRDGKRDEDLPVAYGNFDVKTIADPE